MSGAVKKNIKDYILNEFLPGEDPAELTDTTPLITGRIIDSIVTVRHQHLGDRLKDFRNGRILSYRRPSESLSMSWTEMGG